MSNICWVQCLKFAQKRGDVLLQSNFVHGVCLQAAAVDNEVKGVTHVQRWCDQHGGRQTCRAPSLVERCPLRRLWELEPGGRTYGEHCVTSLKPLSRVSHRWLAQGHFYMWTGGGGDPTTNPVNPVTLYQPAGQSISVKASNVSYSRCETFGYFHC